MDRVVRGKSQDHEGVVRPGAVRPSAAVPSGPLFLYRHAAGMPVNGMSKT
jgi:hypothetical protein